ncbi:MAG: VIT domain-containing protein [Phycisphaerales bacterium]
MDRTRTALIATALVTSAFLGWPVFGQRAGLAADLPEVSHVVVPQRHGFALDRARRPVVITEVRASVRIVDQAATTTLDIALKNESDQRAEAILLLPAPPDAVVSAFMFDGATSEPTAQVLPRHEARRIYDSIVAQVRDPALLEFAGYNLIRSSVFPVEPNGAQRIRLTYETILEADGDRLDYMLPRSESLETRVPWTIDAEIDATHAVSMVYSPTHELEVERHDAQRLRAAIANESRFDPGPFRLSILLERDEVSASLFAYPDPRVGGGYFLMIAGLPADLDSGAAGVRREVTLVLDRSGSMAGGKLDQVREAALQVIEGLADGERINIIDYSTSVAMFDRRPVAKSAESVRAARDYLDRLRPTGGTNIHDALLEALRQPATDEMLPIVLFLTDGLPTVGVTRETSIRELVEQGNPHARRIFTFGVGADVNAPLLDRVAEISRGASAYVTPAESVETAVTKVFRKLYGPTLANLELTVHDDRGVESTQLVTELMPVVLPDLFDGDQLLLVGQYRTDEPMEFRLSGDFLGETRRFRFRFDLDAATTRHSFVPRLWASRRIAYLVDAIRQAGAVHGADPTLASFDPWNDPAFRELTDEIVRLSTEFGVLSEYTSFLAREGTDLSNWEGLVFSCGNELHEKAIQTRSGLAAVNQSWNVMGSKSQAQLNYRNTWINDQMEVVETAAVQQMCDRAFFKRGDRWIDGELVENQSSVEPDEVVDFGSVRHLELVHDLARQDRQGLLAMPGEILLELDGRVVLVRNNIP